MADEEKELKKGETRQLRLEPYTPEGMIAQFATTFSLTVTEHEAYLSFFQPEIPYLSASSVIEEAPPARSRCVARIVVTPKGIQVLADLLNQHTSKRSTDGEST